MNDGIAIFIWLLQVTMGAGIVVGVVLCVLWHIALLMAVARAAATTDWRFSIRDLLALMTLVAVVLAVLAFAMRISAAEFAEFGSGRR
jgi:hypothetical protein